MKKNQKQVTTLAGRRFLVDTSNRACKPFGFQHGDEVLIPNGEECTIVGVAPIDKPHLAHRNVLWYTKKGKKGKVGYWSPLLDEADLLKQGFKLKTIPKSK